MKWKEWLMATPIYDLLGKRSYAQSGEDLIAAIELTGGHGGPPLRGFYVDVGAYHPKLFSNTYLFYKKGWRGVCVEPNPDMGRLHKLVRPKDEFVNCGVGGSAKGGLSTEKLKNSRTQDNELLRIDSGSAPGMTARRKDDVMTYYIFEDGAANTFSKEQAERNVREAGRKIIGKKRIEIKSLKEILNEYIPRGQQIDLLSVDVEGMDEEVLRSSDWKKYKPKVIIAEDLRFDFNRYYLMDSRLPDAAAGTGRGNDKGVVGFLEDQGYGLVAKTPYSLIFKL